MGVCRSMNIEEASININNKDPVIAIESAITCTNSWDDYSLGFRNGLRYALYILTGEEPKYESKPL